MRSAPRAEPCRAPLYSEVSFFEPHTRYIIIIIIYNNIPIGTGNLNDKMALHATFDVKELGILQRFGVTYYAEYRK